MPKESTLDILSSLIPNKTRLRDADGFVATIRYIGPVASAKKSNETYVGVEWDDPHRGLHDGSVISRSTNELVRHFSLKNPSGTGGSFLRLNKIDTGVELNFKLINSRYVDPDAPLVAPNNLLPFSARTSSGRDKPIEFLGEMKVRKRQQMEDLDDISLRSMGISTIPSRDSDAGKQLMKTFEHLKELDVSGNLFSDWKDILDILHIFPNLTWLSFASNKIHDMPSTIQWKDGGFDRLQVLNLNKCSIASFQTVLALDKLCPNLEELCVAYSDLSDMGAKSENPNDTSGCTTDLVKGFSSLELLDCSNCNLQHWNAQIRRLSHLPKLATLILDDNPIKEASIQHPHEFAQVEHLQITGNEIDTWAAVESLALLPNLKGLRFRKCPLTNGIGTGEARAGTIARLPQIEILNASDISEKERLEAERRYVSSVSREMLLLNSNSKVSEGCKDDPSSIANSFKKLGLYEKYPRFEELMTKHKESMLLLSQSANVSGASISSNALNVTIRSMAVESCTIDPVRKRLPSSLKVGRLKIMCAKVFGLDIDLQLLHFRSEVRLLCIRLSVFCPCLCKVQLSNSISHRFLFPQGDAFPTELDDDDNTLGYYGVSDNAEILMNEIDVKNQALEEEKRTKERKQIIKDQENRSNTIHAIRQKEIHASTVAAGNASNRLARE